MFQINSNNKTLIRKSICESERTTIIEGEKEKRKEEDDEEKEM